MGEALVVYFVVLSFWSEGELHRQVSNTLPDRPTCEQMAGFDVKRYRGMYGNAEAECLASPPLPKGTAPAPRKPTPLGDA